MTKHVFCGQWLQTTCSVLCCHNNISPRSKTYFNVLLDIRQHLYNVLQALRTHLILPSMTNATNCKQCLLNEMRGSSAVFSSTSRLTECWTVTQLHQHHCHYYCYLSPVQSAVQSQAARQHVRCPVDWSISYQAASSIHIHMPSSHISICSIVNTTTSVNASQCYMQWTASNLCPQHVNSIFTLIITSLLTRCSTNID